MARHRVALLLSFNRQHPKTGKPLLPTTPGAHSSRRRLPIGVLSCRRPAAPQNPSAPLTSLSSAVSNSSVAREGAASYGARLLDCLPSLIEDDVKFLPLPALRRIPKLPEPPRGSSSAKKKGGAALAQAYLTEPHEWKLPILTDRMSLLDDDTDEHYEIQERQAAAITNSIKTEQTFPENGESAPRTFSYSGRRGPFISAWLAAPILRGRSSCSWFVRLALRLPVPHSPTSAWPAVPLFFGEPRNEDPEHADAARRRSSTSDRSHSLLAARAQDHYSVGVTISDRQARKWAEQRLREGVATARAGDQQLALHYFDSALLLAPDMADALTARGAAKANLGQFSEALDDISSALSVEPEHPNALKYRSAIEEKMKASGIPVPQVPIRQEAKAVQRRDSHASRRGSNLDSATDPRLPGREGSLPSLLQTPSDRPLPTTGSQAEKQPYDTRLPLLLDNSLDAMLADASTLSGGSIERAGLRAGRRHSSSGSSRRNRRSRGRHRKRRSRRASPSGSESSTSPVDDSSLSVSSSSSCRSSSTSRDSESSSGSPSERRRPTHRRSSASPPSRRRRRSRSRRRHSREHRRHNRGSKRRQRRRK
eukprot:GHVT01033246.1.p1 GENE.GHVT01033246.1~~GHVT01033246.1.p1  ORF type:complete len:595 (-),score=98.47 GHVT01033246.1:210-1994(-)